MYSPEITARIAQLRVKASDGTISIEEMRESVKLIRQGRMVAADAAAKSKSASGGKAKKPTKSADEMLNELAGL
jgi:hypothetical protein